MSHELGCPLTEAGKFITRETSCASSSRALKRLSAVRKGMRLYFFSAVDELRRDSIDGSIKSICQLHVGDASRPSRHRAVPLGVITIQAKHVRAAESMCCPSRPQGAKRQPRLAELVAGAAWDALPLAEGSRGLCVR
ncbi:unnamed protein product [Symbiodinium natans]|uniref:Uncharacterized protein n=1 Tax=Symbiodinium natans TaxID=878477 RepID=A0A812L807_9DINO|nr:unnamed protein product [Symbiodinium natans]